jgi:hypothetical protein
VKYTVTITGPGAGEREKIVLESRAGESARHIALKILAYVLYRDRTGGLPLRIEQRAGHQRHKPDLVAAEPETGRVRLWIDCGQIETKRLGRIAAVNAGGRVVVVKPGETEARLYGLAALRYLPPLGLPGAAESVAFLGFEDAFFDAFLARLRGTNTLHLETRPGDAAVLALEWNDEPLATTLRPLDAAALARQG